jgi:hypothetical protein
MTNNTESMMGSGPFVYKLFGTSEMAGDFVAFQTISGLANSTVGRQISGPFHKPLVYTK